MAQTNGDYVESCVEQNKVILRWVSTKENIADIMTKLLP